MPAKLDRCVTKLIKQGYSKSSAYAICSKSTGYVRNKNNRWIKKRKKG